MAKDLQEDPQFPTTFVGFQSDQGFLLASYLVTLGELGFASYAAHLAPDTSRYGDILAALWDLYDCGDFNSAKFFSADRKAEPTTLADRYLACGIVSTDDYMGHRQFFDIPGSMWAEFRVCDAEGDWPFSRHALMATTTAKFTSNSGWRRPLVSGACTVPSSGGVDCDVRPASLF